MAQETLEEASKNPINYTKETNGYPKIQAFIDGAKWQSEISYSENEVKKLAFNFYYDMSRKMSVHENLISENFTNLEEWFEQFKKK
jgi:hypothetical protein